LVHLIETHSDEIAKILATTIKPSAQMMEVQGAPKFELLLIVVRDLLQQLREWLLNNRKTEIEAHYRETGAWLAGQEVAAAEACRIVVVTKEHLWRYLQEQALPNPVELYGEMELLWILSQFFDRALCCIVEGYGQSGYKSRPQSKHPEVNFANWIP
jgi:hypothetical protein